MNPANNQFTGTGYSYGPKGNLLGLNNFSFIYDAENRMASATAGSFVESYNYDESNLRVEKQGSNGDEIYFYGPDGKLLTIFGGTSPISRVYFGGMLLGSTNGTTTSDATVFADRLGTVTPGYPYGTAIGSPAGNDQVDFATYMKDGSTGLDYAINRHYGEGSSRFLEVDRGRSMRMGIPQSWNRYTYVQGDPVNHLDPSGLSLYDPVWNGGCYQIGLLEQYGYAGNIGGTACAASMAGPLWDLESALEDEYASYVQDAFSQPFTGNVPCEQDTVKQTITQDANNLGLNLDGYNLAGSVASIGGQTSGVLPGGSGAVDSMTELVVGLNAGESAEAAWAMLTESLGSAFSLAPYDSLHPGFGYSYRENTSQWSMQISFNPSHSRLEIDIDPWNPQSGGLVGHIGDVLTHMLTGNDTNYNSVANALGESVPDCNQAP